MCIIIIIKGKYNSFIPNKLQPCILLPKIQYQNLYHWQNLSKQIGCDVNGMALSGLGLGQENEQQSAVGTGTRNPANK